FGGKGKKVEIEGQGVSTEGTLNLIVIELGAPGLLLWLGLAITVIGLAVRRLRHIVDIELRTYLVAIFAIYISKHVAGFGGPNVSRFGGALLWFAPGGAAYWLLCAPKPP